MAQAKNTEAQNKTIADSEKAFILNQSTYNTNKGYYQNFDAQNTKFNNIIADRSALLTNSPDGTITDEQANMIASKYGVTADEVKNPNKVWEGLTPTEEGKQKLGITAHDQQMTDAATANQRALEDAKTNMAITEQNYNNQISDVQKQLNRNINWAQASGAWSGGLKSSGYLSGIENIRKDGQETINRLKTALENVKNADAKNVARMTEDYNNMVSRAKTDFDTQLKDIQHNAGLNLNELTNTYGVGTKEFTKALEDINAKYGANSMDITAKYMQNMNAINTLTNQGIELQQKQQSINDAAFNKQYNSYLENNGLKLQNTTYSSIAQDVNSGLLSYEQGAILKNSIANSIVSTLQKLGTVTTADLDTINHMLAKGQTATDVVAAMQTLDKFIPKDTFKPNIEVVGEYKDENGETVKIY